MDRATLRQALVQCLLQRRMTKRADAYAAYQRLATHMGVDEAFDADLDAIHASLAPLGWDVRACHDQVRAEPYLLVVNAKSDELAQVATPYSAAELQYIKALVHAIFHAPQYALPSIQALQLATHTQPVPLTKQTATQLLANLERRQWLHHLPSGAYTLTLRALHELDTYIRHELDEACVLECMACYAIVTRGVRCAWCRGAVHTSCQSAYEAGHATCAACGAAWQPVPVGESLM